MSGKSEPANASIDRLIEWLRQLRSSDLTSPLSALLSGHPIKPELLVDLACIDLMQRRRMGHDVSVENYVAEFPCLASEANRLDLIDAELCVAEELGDRMSTDQYTRRFPDLAEQVRELAQLQPAVESPRAFSVLGIPDQPNLVQACSSSQAQLHDVQLSISEHVKSPDACEFSFGDVHAQVERETQFRVIEPELELPHWFMTEQCIAVSPGRWLYRGRDSVRGTALALKICSLPTQSAKQQLEQLLDACEMASKVQNPVWTTPIVATIQDHRLGVIRPWFFARPWHEVRLGLPEAAQLRQLSLVAFAVAAGHRWGASHGGIHAENLIIGHDSKIRLVDAASSRRGLMRWTSCRNPSSHGEQIASLDERKKMDVRSLVALIASDSIESTSGWSEDLVDDLRRIANQEPIDGCPSIGQRLVEQADRIDAGLLTAPRSRTRRSWRGQLVQWLAGNRHSIVAAVARRR